MNRQRAWDLARYYLALTPPRMRAAWYLRRAKHVGAWPGVGGRPCVEAVDLEIGDQFKVWSTHRRTLISGWGRIRIGDRVFINSGSMVFSVEAITIGDDVALSSEVYITDTNSHGVEGRDPVVAPVRIGSGSWIGTRAVILPGVTIGRRVLVAAGSVVSRDVPDDSLVAGNPGRVVRTLTYPPGCLRAWHDDQCSCPLKGEVAAYLRAHPSGVAAAAQQESAADEHEGDPADVRRHAGSRE